MLGLLKAIVELITAMIPRKTIVVQGEPNGWQDTFDSTHGPSIGLRTRRMLGCLVAAIILTMLAIHWYPEFPDKDLPFLVNLPISLFAVGALWQLMHITRDAFRLLFL